MKLKRTQTGRWGMFLVLSAVWLLAVQSVSAAQMGGLPEESMTVGSENGTEGDESATEKLVWEENDGSWNYYVRNPNTAAWELQTNVWSVINDAEYYFDSNGRCTKIYNPDAGTFQRYSDDGMKRLKNGIGLLHDGKKYYFNAKGKIVTDKGWQTISGREWVQVGKNGNLVSKMKKVGKLWRFYKYEYDTQKWIKQKAVWKTVNQKKYYFNKSGKCMRIYNTVSGMYSVYRGGKMQAAENEVCSIGKKEYFFGAEGKKAELAGLYLTASGKVIRTKEDGELQEEISGELLAYETADGRITNCRLKDGDFMCYYVSSGALARKIHLKQPMVALTYDDGPSVYTPEILEVLRQNNSLATFFVVGERVSSYQTTLKSASEMGCQIGNHTYNHKILTKIGVPSIQSQIEKTNAAVKEITGRSPVVMRPPGGSYNAAVKGAVGMPLILWSIDTKDWKTRNAYSTQTAVLNHVKDGDIVLMHDLYKQTAEASKIVIPELVRRGYQLVTVSELSDCRGALSAGSVYHSLR